MPSHSQKSPNHLIREKSPYLLQHAYNPVHWYPWGGEAFQKSKLEDKPIFLSIGYSTCHWCHVMEEESFENQAVADILNEYFVSIKVDREERPDVDGIYMKAVMAMTGSGGWPMSVFLTPDLEPFYGGTYFPPESRYGRPGFLTILNAIADKWKTEKGSMTSAGKELAGALRADSENEPGQKAALDQKLLSVAFHQLESQYDGALGGFGGAPKFPRSHVMSYLFRFWKRSGESVALDMSLQTLREMAKGGMYDHVGGGFHRYSTDAKWHIPHFEKMLYDQALIAKTYLEAYQATHEENFANVAGEIFNYVLHDMKAPEGAFYSAEDADSLPEKDSAKKTEGAFYIWSEKEILALLGEKNGKFFNFIFGVEPDGNAETDPHGEFTGKNILYLAHSIDEAAKNFNKTEEEIKKIVRESKTILLKARAERPKPHLDDKILADWNGLMISALASGSLILRNPCYAEVACKAADFIMEKMTIHGKLMHRYRDGEVAIEGFLDDYAFFSNALLDLYEATFQVRYLSEAARLVERMNALFWDGKSGGYFFSSSGGEKLIARSKEIYDGAIPSGNSVAAMVLVRLNRMTAKSEYEKRAGELFDAFSVQLAQFPAGYPQMMMAFDFSQGPSREIVIAGNQKAEEVRKIADIIFSTFSPNQVVLFHPQDGSEAEAVEQLAPFVKSQGLVSGKPAVYICENYTCSLPVTDVSDLKKKLGVSGNA